VTDAFEIEALSSRHNRASFACGIEALDRYLVSQASQDVRRNIANCFVACPVIASTIAGYYTLSAAGVAIGDLPEDVVKRLPRYENVPAALLGRLAVDAGFRGRGLGRALLFDAARRAMDAGPAVFALLVDAKDERARDFYRHYRFESLRSRPMTLFIPLSRLRNLLTE
jgi:ribosomal protein S18 acetylase RimI-like enzyme